MHSVNTPRPAATPIGTPNPSGATSSANAPMQRNHAVNGVASGPSPNDETRRGLPNLLASTLFNMTNLESPQIDRRGFIQAVDSRIVYLQDQVDTLNETLAAQQSQSPPQEGSSGGLTLEQRDARKDLNVILINHLNFAVK